MLVSGSGGHEATVDRYEGAVDHGGAVAEQEDDRLDGLTDLDEAAHRDLRGHLPPPPGLAPVLAPHGCPDDGRIDRVDSNVVGAQLLGTNLGHHVQGGLAGRVGQMLIEGHQAGHARDVDDRAELPLLHALRHHANQTNGPLQVDSQGHVELVDGHLVAGATEGVGGVVDEKVNLLAVGGQLSLGRLPVDQVGADHSQLVA